MQRVSFTHQIVVSVNRNHVEDLISIHNEICGTLSGRQASYQISYLVVVAAGGMSSSEQIKVAPQQECPVRSIQSIILSSLLINKGITEISCRITCDQVGTNKRFLLGNIAKIQEVVNAYQLAHQSEGLQRRRYVAGESREREAALSSALNPLRIPPQSPVGGEVAEEEDEKKTKCCCCQ